MRLTLWFPLERAADPSPDRGEPPLKDVVRRHLAGAKDSSAILTQIFVSLLAKSLKRVTFLLSEPAVTSLPRRVSLHALPARLGWLSGQTGLQAPE